jgi:chromosome partitioning protein
MTAMLARNYDHIVTDTEQAPDDEDLQAMANGSDLLVIPAVPNPSDTDGLVDTIEALRKMKRTNYKVLLTRVTSHEAGDALELRRQLAEIGAPVFVGEIPELKVFRKASGRGVIVSAVKRDPEAKRAWAAYAAVGKELGL